MKKTVSQSFHPVSYKNVGIDDHFWSPRLKVNRESTIPYEYEQCKKTGRIDVFKLNQDAKKLNPHIFWDSDVAKWIEAASYTLSQHYDSRLDEQMDEVIDLIQSAQQPDGYLNTYYTLIRPEDRWTDLEGGHELYCAGHMIEAAVAHFEATGKKTLLDVVCGYADYIDSVFGKEPEKKRGYPGHEEIELALVKLYRVTREERYLHLSQYFINERGQLPNYFDEERQNWKEPGFLNTMAGDVGNQKEYNQSHKPVREQEKPVGHAVRAMYLYTAMADLANELGEQSLLHACERLWDQLVDKRMYITGGIGSTEKNEGFTDDYDLPNETSYAETCAAIGSIFWNHRMLQFSCDRRYADLLERTLYNAVLVGVSLDGENFFYGNPLQSNGDVHRQEWFDVACCPPNIARLLSSLGQYIYSQSDRDLAVHLFVQSTCNTEINGHNITFHQKTNYPWDSKSEFTINLEEPARFGLRLRIPQWCTGYKILVNAQEYEAAQDAMENGYVRLEQLWENGDTVELRLSMPVKRIYAHPNVRQCVGKVALQRGPLIYCLEQVDHSLPVTSIFLPDNGNFKVDFKKELLNGISTISGEALAMTSSEGAHLYGSGSPEMKKCSFKAIPYYSWDNRESGPMTVWVHEYKGD